MTSRESKEVFSSVHAYLRAITIAGGIAAASMPMALHSMLELSVKDPTATIVHTSSVIGQHTLPVIEVVGVAIVEPTDVSTSEKHDFSESLIPEQNPDVTDSDQKSANPLPEQAFVHEAVNEEKIIPEILVVPHASVDVFPVGYGSFKIVIQSDSDGQYQASLLDHLNREVAAENYDVTMGENTFIMESGSIPRGEYLLRVTNGNVVSEKKVRMK
jgi:hypothetical protein